MPTPLYGQITMTGSAIRLTSNTADVTAFTIVAPISNSKPVYLGDVNVTTSTGRHLDPGREFNYERLAQSGQPQYQLKPSDFYVVGTASDTVSWLASP